MNKNEKAALCACPLFCGLESHEIEDFLKKVPYYRESFSSGDEILLEKDGKTRMGILLSGKVKILSPSDKTVLNRLEAGALFGVSCLYGEKSAGTEISAVGSAKVLFLDGAESEALWENPRLRKNLLSFLLSRIRFLNQRIASFTAHSSEDKLLCYLRQNADEEHKILLRQSLSELARTLHLGRASLYRAMEKLESDGVLVRSGKMLVLTESDETVLL